MSSPPSPDSPHIEFGIPSAKTFKSMWYERIKTMHQYTEFASAVEEAVRLALLQTPPKREIVVVVSIDCVDTLGQEVIVEVLTESGYTVRDMKRDDSQAQFLAEVSFTFQNEVRTTAPA